MTTPPFDLERFVTAQAPVHDIAMDELRAGRKRSHWMWFVFPQVAGLGSSPMSQFYAIGTADEARAYLTHPVLGPRLREATEIVTASQAGSLPAVLGHIDAVKFQSCMTLFAQVAAPGDTVFTEALRRWCGGLPDTRTLELLRE